MNKNKKLIMFMPSIDGGGVEKNLIIISNYLAKKIEDIHLITFDKSFNKFFDNKIKIINFVNSNSKPASKYYKYLTCLYLLCKNCIFTKKKVVVFSFQANLYCILLSIILRFSIIVRPNSSPTGWSGNFLKKKIFSFFFSFADSVIVNSYEFKKQLLIQFKIDSEVIYNPLNTREIIKNSKKKFDINFFNDKKSLKIINVSRFTHQKDHITLLRSFKIITKKINSELLIVGYGPEKSKIIEYINKNKLEKKVKVLDYNVNPFKYIARADLFVLTSIYEGLPNVLLESICLRKFVISSNCPTGPKEILASGKYGFLFKMKDHLDLSKKILNYHKSKKYYNFMIKKAFNSLNRFNYEKNCEKYLNIIIKVFNQKTF